MVSRFVPLTISIIHSSTKRRKKAMIEIDKLAITISAADCPNLHYRFDFSDFYNKNLARECVKLLSRKYDQGVSLTYLRVLSTALVHYDSYLRKNRLSKKLPYSASDKRKYLNHLNSVCINDNKLYSKKYINFLAYVPGKLNTGEEEGNERE